MLPTALALAASYLLGAIPTSYLAARLRLGIDLRQHGSGNLGATNLYRVMGLRWAVPVALFDMAKGAVPALVVAPLAAPGSVRLAIACGLTAVLGHSLSVFVRFRGGKGVATGAGMVAALAPVAALVALVVWGLVVWRTRVVSLASILAALVLPVAIALLYRGQVELLVMVSLLCGFVVWRHRSNIRRLLGGTEARVGGDAQAPRRRPTTKAPPDTTTHSQGNSHPPRV